MINKIITSFVFIILLLTSGCTSTQPDQKSNLTNLTSTSNYISDKNPAEYITLYTNSTCIIYSIDSGKSVGVYKIEGSRLRIYKNKSYKDYAFTNDTIVVKTITTGKQHSQLITYRKQ